MTDLQSPEFLMRQGVCFVFGTRESLWPGMGLYLLQEEGVVKDVLLRGETIIEKRLGWSLLATLASTGPFPEAALEPINTVTQIALAAKWQERGVHPSGLICRCGGEFAGAYTSGAIDFEDALEHPCRIAGLIDGGLGRGKTVIVCLSSAEAEVLRFSCPVRYETVGEAGPAGTVVACDLKDAETLNAFFSNRNIVSRNTGLTLAFHTWLVDECRSDLLRPLTKSAQSSAIPIYSATARGRLVDPKDWALHFWRVERESLSIRAAISAAFDDGFTRFLEVGGQPTLKPFIEEEAATRGLSVTSLATMERNRPLTHTLDETFDMISDQDLCV